MDLDPLAPFEAGALIGAARRLVVHGRHDARGRDPAASQLRERFGDEADGQPVALLGWGNRHREYLGAREYAPPDGRAVPEGLPHVARGMQDTRERDESREDAITNEEVTIEATRVFRDRDKATDRTNGVSDDHEGSARPQHAPVEPAEKPRPERGEEAVGDEVGVQRGNAARVSAHTRPYRDVRARRGAGRHGRHQGVDT